MIADTSPICLLRARARGSRRFSAQSLFTCAALPLSRSVLVPCAESVHGLSCPAWRSCANIYISLVRSWLQELEGQQEPASDSQADFAGLQSFLRENNLGYLLANVQKEGVASLFDLVSFLLFFFIMRCMSLKDFCWWSYMLPLKLLLTAGTAKPREAGSMC